ncbi:hypothetical protein GW17_00037958 [Ensete ventricosum]|nr:hypothetical protein GW17_00037958 [Ensete ventricosum]
MGQDQARALGRVSDDVVGPRWEFAKNRRRDREAGWEHAGRSIEEDRKTHHKNAGGCQIGGRFGLHPKKGECRCASRRRTWEWMKAG